MRARFVMVKSDPSLAFGFPDFLRDNWQTNGCVPLRIVCSVLFYWYDCDMSSLSEKTGNHLLGRAACASNFCWIWHSLKHPYSLLLFSFRLIRVNPQFITCHRRVSKYRYRMVGAFLWTNRHEPFFERLTNCVRPVTMS